MGKHVSKKAVDLENLGRRPEQVEILKRFFKGLPVREADGDLLVSVLRSDGVYAKRNNPEECVFSKSCQRLYNSTAVVFFAKVVYMDLPDEEGNRVVFRFLGSEKMCRAIKKYDETGTFEPGIYKLLAPAKSQQLNVIRERSRLRTTELTKAKKRVLERRRKALIKNKARRVKTLTSAGIVGFVRNGGGLVQTKVAA